MDALHGQIIAVREIFILGRSLDESAHTHALTVTERVLIRQTDEHLAADGDFAFVKVDGFDLHVQIEIGIALIGRLKQNAGDIGFMDVVVVIGDIRRGNARLSHLVARRAEKQKTGQEQNGQSPLRTKTAQHQRHQHGEKGQSEPDQRI